MRLVAAAVSALAAASLAAAPRKSAPASGGGADGGTRSTRAAKLRAPPKPTILGDPPGTLSNWREAQKEGPDGGHEPSASVQELQREIADLRTRTGTLEKQIAATQQQTEVLQQMSQQLADLRGQMAGAEDRRDEAQQRTLLQRQQSEDAIAGLVSAQSVLAGGGSDVSFAIDAADQSLTPQARRDLGAARSAIQNHDLSAARTYLQSAIADAQAGR